MYREEIVEKYALSGRKKSVNHTRVKTDFPGWDPVRFSHGCDIVNNTLCVYTLLNQVLD